jgi:hypothetical protein
MDDRTTTTLDIKTSRNGLPVPVVKGIHLHSVYNPAKEAEAFAEKYLDTLKTNNHVLILGLGFGYHIDQIEKVLSDNHEHFNILVLEPNKKIVEGFKTFRAFKNTHITIIDHNEVEPLFESSEFINFLRQKPAIIKHDPSFNLEKTFYTKFLKYKAPTEVSQYSNRLSDILQMYLTDFDDLERPITEVISEIKNERGIRNRFDFGLLAFDAIISASKEEQVSHE